MRVKNRKHLDSPTNRELESELKVSPEKISRLNFYKDKLKGQNENNENDKSSHKFNNNNFKKRWKPSRFCR